MVGQYSVKMRLPLWTPNNFRLEFSSVDRTSFHRETVCQTECNLSEAQDQAFLFAEEVSE